ncbi:type II toxin-antitoxin system VapC family toxin [Sodalis sp. RH19]|uniref:type II toxin-antitoxin system VapC family toxin n=1 Tax=Sodalis sp. RH19 TaxID=3394334 RepID=UPI0039B3CC2F
MPVVQDVLVDTSVWIEHFRQNNVELVDLMMQDRVLIHPFVLTELACGTPPTPRRRTLGDLALLRTCHSANQTEVRNLIEQEGLYGQGCGLVDMTLLASTLITPNARLWTLDKRLATLAVRLGINWPTNAL